MNKNHGRKIEISKNLFYKVINAFSFSLISYINSCFPKISGSYFLIRVIRVISYKIK